MHPLILEVPRYRVLVRHAVPRIAEGSIAPAVIVFTALQIANRPIAVLLGMGWVYAAIVRRIRRRERVPGLLLLSALTMTTRAIVTILLGSMLVYVLQPTLGASITAGVLIISVIAGQPLAARLSRDFCPLDDNAAAHPTMHSFFRHASLLWACVNLINIAFTVWMLVQHSVATVVLARSIFGAISNALALLVAMWWLRATMHGSGVTVVRTEARIARMRSR